MTEIERGSSEFSHAIFTLVGCWNGWWISLAISKKCFLRRLFIIFEIGIGDDCWSYIFKNVYLLFKVESYWQ